MSEMRDAAAWGYLNILGQAQLFGYFGPQCAHHLQQVWHAVSCCSDTEAVQKMSDAAVRSYMYPWVRPSSLATSALSVHHLQQA